MNALYLVMYLIPILWICFNRHKPTFRTRSPIIIIVGLFHHDSSLHIEYLVDDLSWKHGRIKKMQCDLSVLITVFLTFSVMSIYIVRMWRVFIMYSCFTRSS